MANTASGAVSSATASTSPASATDLPTTPISTPIDPTERWFFDFPPELRNQIYEALFEPALPRYLVQCYNKEDPQDSVALRLRSPSPGVNVLRTCKQIHAEAAPYLYRKIVILASASLSLRQLMTITADWLERIGHDIAKPSTVHIGLTNDTLNDFSFDNIDVLPIIAFMDGRVGQFRIPISFELSTRDKSPNMDDLKDADQVSVVKAINRILQILHTHSELRTYLRYWRNLRSVVVSDDGRSVDLQMRSSDDMHVRFDLNEAGQLVKMPAPTPPTPAEALDRILSIPPIRDNIFACILKRNSEIKVDLEERTFSPGVPHLLLFNSGFQGPAIEYYYHHNSFLVSLSSTDGHFALDSLRHWLQHGMSCHRWVGYRSSLAIRVTSVRLVFDDPVS